MSFLTDRTVGTVLTVNDKIHVVDVDDLTGSPLGTSKQYTLQQLKTIVDSDTQDLENVLTYGNTMSDGQTIEAENGVSVFDPRFLGVDNNMSIYTGTHGSLGVGNESYIDLTPSYLGYGHGKAFLTMADFGATQTIFFGSSSDFFTANHSVLALSESSVSLKFVKAGLSKSGLISIENNDLASYTTANIDNFPVNIGSKNALISASIVNSAYLGGTNIKVKTSNTAYANQLGFNSGEAFETILNYTTATANNTVTVQDGSGTLAFLTDITGLNGMYDGSGTVPAATVITMADGELDFEYIANDALNLNLTNTDSGASSRVRFRGVTDVGGFTLTSNGSGVAADAGDTILSVTGGDMIFNQGTSNRDMFFRVGGSTAFAMHGLSGFMGIGIGETTPTEKLEIGGNMLVSGVYKVGTNKVVGARISGWSTASGTASRTSFDTSTVTTEQLAERVKALIDDLDSASGHGLIGS